MLSILLFAFAIAAPPKPAPPPERERLMVVLVEVASDLAAAIGTEQRLRIESDVASIVRRYQRLNVVTSSEVKRLIDLEADRQAVGCDDSCAAEIASALGARWILATRLERTAIGTQLIVTLTDANGAGVVARGRAQGQRPGELQHQLPFAVDDAVTSLRLAGDPTPGEILAASRPALGVLPVRAKKQAAAFTAAVNTAAQAAARQLVMRVLSVDDFSALATRRGCAADDLACVLPAGAADGMTVALGVSVNDSDTGPVVSATLLSPTGTAVGRGSAPLMSWRADSIATAVTAAVDAALRARNDTSATNAAVSSAVAATPTASSSVPGRVVTEFACNVMRNGEAVGSQCTLMTDALRVAPHALNLQSHLETVSLDEFSGVETFNALGFVPTGVRLHRRRGYSLDLIVEIGQRDAIIAQLRTQLAAQQR
jgi:hypothetical protein